MSPNIWLAVSIEWTNFLLTFVLIVFCLEKPFLCRTFSLLLSYGDLVGKNGRGLDWIGKGPLVTINYSLYYTNQMHLLHGPNKTWHSQNIISFMYIDRKLFTNFQGPIYTIPNLKWPLRRSLTRVCRCQVKNMLKCLHMFFISMLQIVFI